MKIYLTGIKGTGMASLARILKDAGHEVSGSDIEKYIFTQDGLDEAGIAYAPFDPERINADAIDALVAGLSFGADHPEIARAMELGIPVYWYNEFLGEFLKDYTSVCVAGCHGKSTTTGMLAGILSGTPSGYLIGDGQGKLDENARFFVLEACEFKRHFLAYYPDYAIITNIELDHVDYYRDIEDYTSAFQSFVNQVSKAAVINGDDPVLSGLDYACRCIRFGFEQGNDYRIASLVQGEFGLEYDLIHEGEILAHVRLSQTGKAYAYDSAAALVMGHVLGVSIEECVRALEHFQGIHRRFDVDEVGSSVLIDDYAHHPTAISLMIESARQRYPGKKVIALYKPDRFSRVQYFLDDFAKALNTADESIVFDFPSNARREDESITVTIEDLLERLGQGTLGTIDADFARSLADRAPAVFLFMSSKDIYLLRDALLEELSTSQAEK